MDNTVGSRQQDLIIGTLLGDGFLEKNGRNFRLVMGHSLKQLEYVKWKQQMLLPLTSTLAVTERLDARTNKSYHYATLRTKTAPIFKEYFDLFYRNGHRIIPANLPNVINPRMLAIWVMDDGYKRNDCNALRLNTQAYSYAEQLLIQKSLQRLSLEARIQHHKKTFVIYIPSSSMTKLRELISPYVVESMRYKVA